MSETCGTESGSFWSQDVNQSRWTCHSDDKEAMDRGQRIWYHRAHEEPNITSLTRPRDANCQPGIGDTQGVSTFAAHEVAGRSDMTCSGSRVESHPSPPAASLEISRHGEQSASYIGGIANMMRISPYRCALCNFHFCNNGKKVRQWFQCGGEVWHPSYRRRYFCKAWLCQFDDQCQNAGAPCPCCKKIKKLQISKQPIAEIPDDNCTAAWYDEKGLFHSLHDV